jgi:hypothetical protein
VVQESRVFVGCACDVDARCLSFRDVAFCLS